MGGHGGRRPGVVGDVSAPPQFGALKLGNRDRSYRTLNARYRSFLAVYCNTANPDFLMEFGTAIQVFGR